MTDGSYCFELPSGSCRPPTQTLYWRLQPWDPVSRETSFHSATACTDCNSQQKMCCLPWSGQASCLWGHQQSRARSQQGGITTSSWPTALRWARPPSPGDCGCPLCESHRVVCANIYLCIHYSLQQFYFCYFSMNNAFNGGKMQEVAFYLWVVPLAKC